MSTQLRVRRTPPPEYLECVWFHDWCLVHRGQEPRLTWLYHTPNGEARDKRIAAKLAAMGVEAGVVDYFAPSPVPPFPGLWLEMKRAGLTPRQAWAACSTAQRAFLTAMEARGYAIAVASGWVHAAQLVCTYLGRQDLAPEGDHYA